MKTKKTTTHNITDRRWLCWRDKREIGEFPGRQLCLAKTVLLGFHMYIFCFIWILYFFIQFIYYVFIILGRCCAFVSDGIKLLNIKWITWYTSKWWAKTRINKMGESYLKNYEKRLFRQEDNLIMINIYKKKINIIHYYK